MRLAYIDESYTHDVYFIGAVMVDDHSAPALERALDDVAEQAQKAYLPLVTGPLELHGHPLFHGAKEWSPIKNQVRALVSIYEQAIGQRLDEQVLVIADEIDDPNRHRANLHDFRIAGTPGYRSSQLPNILDTLHFVPSEHSRLIQAADLVTFLHRRKTTVVETNPKQAHAVERIWGHVAGRVQHQLLTRP